MALLRMLPRHSPASWTRSMVDAVIAWPCYLSSTRIARSPFVHAARVATSVARRGVVGQRVLSPAGPWTTSVRRAPARRAPVCRAAPRRTCLHLFSCHATTCHLMLFAQLYAFPHGAFIMSVRVQPRARSPPWRRRICFHADAVFYRVRRPAADVHLFFYRLLRSRACARCPRASPTFAPAFYCTTISSSTAPGQVFPRPATCLRRAPWPPRDCCWIPHHLPVTSARFPARCRLLAARSPSAWCRPPPASRCAALYARRLRLYFAARYLLLVSTRRGWALLGHVAPGRAFTLSPLLRRRAFTRTALPHM